MTIFCKKWGFLGSKTGFFWHFWGKKGVKNAKKSQKKALFGVFDQMGEKPQKMPFFVLFLRFLRVLGESPLKCTFFNPRVRRSLRGGVKIDPPTFFDIF